MRKSFVLAACAAAALTLTGCGATTTAGAPAPAAAPVPVAQITDATQLADTLTRATQGKNSATMKMDVSAAGQSFGGEGAYSLQAGNVKMRMTVAVPGQSESLEMRLVDRTVYVKLPASSGGQGWLKMPVDANNPQTAEFAKLLDQVDVTKQYDQFRSGQLKGQAPEVLDGVQTTRYDITVDVDKAIAAQPDAATRAQLEPLAQAGVKTLDTQIWADAENLPRQIRVSTSAQGQNGVTTIKLSDWGAPVTVEAPPANEVQELPAGN